MTLESKLNNFHQDKLIWKCHLHNGGHFVPVSMCQQYRYIQYRAYWCPGGCFTKVSRALQDILSKFLYYRNRTFDENFKLKLCTWAQSYALGTHTKFQLKIFTINVITGIVYFHEIILESSRNDSETTPWFLASPGPLLLTYFKSSMNK